MDAPTVAPARRAALAFIFITVLLDILAFGLIIPVLRPVYDYAWFVGFGVAALVYLGLAGRHAE